MSMESTYKLSVLVNMIDQLSGPSAQVRRSMEQTGKGFQSYSNQLGEIARNGTALISVGQGAVQATIAPVKAIFGTQDALAELSSLGIENLDNLETAAIEFSMTWAGTTKPQFLTAAYDIKSGIASLSDEGVAGMTRIAGVTAKATKSTTAEMTSLFATGYGIYKDYYNNLSDLEFGEMFSGGIAKSVQQFKTTGSGMAQAISALGGSATAAGAPLEEQLAILGMLQATMSGSEAGTKYTAFLQNAARAGGELGLNFTDVNGQLKGMPEILGQIKGKFGDVMTATDKLELQKAFGTVEAVKLIDLLYGKTNDLQGNILTLYDTMGQGMSITGEMANKINSPPGQSWELLIQKFQTAIETVGNAMLPTFQKLQDAFGKLADWIETVTEKYPSLISNVMFTVMAMGALYIIIGGLKLAFGGFGAAILGAWNILKSIPKIFSAIKMGAFYAKYGLFLLKGALSPLKTGFLTMAGGIKTATVGMFTWAKQGILAAVKALPGLIASVWSFTAALMANPITWVVVAVVALIAALVLLWKNWDSVSAWISGAWSAVCSGVMAGIDRLKSGFDAIVNWFGSLSGWVQGAIAVFMPFIGIPLLIVSHWEQIKSFFVGLIDWFKNIGSSIMKGFTGGIMSFISGPADAVKSALGKVRELLPFSDAKEGPLSDLTLSGQHVFTTFNDGMQMTSDLPAQTAVGAFGQIPPAPAMGPVQAVTDAQVQVNPVAQMNGSLQLSGMPPLQAAADAQIKVTPIPQLTAPEQFSQQYSQPQRVEGAFQQPDAKKPLPAPKISGESKEDSKQTIIQKLVLYVKPSEIADMQKFKKFLDELEDSVNSGGADPVPEV